MTKNKAEITYISPGQAEFVKTVGGFLSMSLKNGKFYDRIDLHRAFPFSYPREYISVRDEEGEEIGLIRSIDEFPGEAVLLMEDELARRYFTPRIKAVKSLKEEFGYFYWDVLTDAGERRFTIHSQDKSVQTLDSGIIIICDMDGNRFELAPGTALTASQARIVENLV